MCFDEFKSEEKVNQLPCQHLYHPDCIKPWLELVRPWYSAGYHTSAKSLYMINIVRCFNVFICWQHGTCPVCRKNLEGEDTTCDQNTQSIPETLENFGLNAASLSPRDTDAQQASGGASSASVQSNTANGSSSNGETRSTNVDDVGTPASASNSRNNSGEDGKNSRDKND